MKKKFMRALCIVLCMLIPLSISPAAFAQVVNNERIMVFDELPTEYLATEGLELRDFAKLYGGDELLAYLAEKLALCEPINVIQFQIPATLISELIYLVWYNLPESFHAKGRMSYSNYGNYVFQLVPTYSYTVEEYAAEMKACNDAADKLLYGIAGNSALGEAEKVLLLHDRLVTYCGYEYEDLLAGTVSDRVYDMTGALVDRRAVCAGYARAYMYLLRKAGIENYYCSSDALNHAWNIVYVNNIPYHVDTTWDDPVYDLQGQARHYSVLLSTAAFSTGNSGHDATDYDTTPAATTFDSFYWQQSDTAFQLIGDVCYYLIKSSSSATLKSTPASTLLDNSDDIDVLTITDTWKAGAGSTWMGNYSSLSSDGRNLFYSDSDGIYKYNVKTGTSSLFYSPDLSGGDYYSLYGFYYDGKTLTTDITNSPNLGSLSNGYRKTITYIDPQTCGAGNHDVVTTIEAIAPTCIEGGRTAASSCRVCEVTLSESTTLAPGEHTSYVSKAAKAATCTEDGNTAETKCSTCNATLTESTVITATGHTSVVSKAAKAATCGAAGNTQETKCSTCNEILTESTVIPATGEHSAYEALTAAAPSCTRDGYTALLYCSICNILLENSETIPATGHTSYVSKAATAATCTANGNTQETKCSKCNNILTASTVITATGHTSFVSKEAKAATCTVDGYTAETKCSTCNEILTESTVITAKGEHTPHIALDAITPTCTINGSTAVIFCDGCGVQLQKFEVIPPTGHTSYVSKTAKAATCTEDGNTQETKCSKCNEILTESTVITATGHTSYVSKTAKAATCTENGNTQETKCSTCNNILTASTVITATGHTSYVSKAAKAATCTENGYTQETKCSTCNNILTASTVVTAQHSAFVSKAAKAATCTENGYTQETKCSACNVILSASTVITATGHTSVVSKAAKAATCTEDGYSQETKCSACNVILSASTAVTATGHMINAQGVCERCGYNTNPQIECDCMCHKTGFIGFIYKIVSFFWRIFNTNQFCDCGAAHW